MNNNHAFQGANKKILVKRMALFYTFANLLSLAPRKTAGFSHLLLHSGCCHVFFGLCLKKTQPRADV